MSIKVFSVYKLGIGNLLNSVVSQGIEQTKVVSVDATSVYNVPGIKTKITHDWGGVIQTDYVNETVADVIAKFG